MIYLKYAQFYMKDCSKQTAGGDKAMEMDILLFWSSNKEDIENKENNISMYVYIYIYTHVTS